MNSPLRNRKDRWVDDNMARDPGIPTAYYYHTLNTLNPSNYTMDYTMTQKQFIFLT